MVSDYTICFNPSFGQVCVFDENSFIRLEFCDFEGCEDGFIYFNFRKVGGISG